MSEYSSNIKNETSTCGQGKTTGKQRGGWEDFFQVKIRKFSHCCFVFERDCLSLNRFRISPDDLHILTVYIQTHDAVLPVQTVPASPLCFHRVPVTEQLSKRQFSSDHTFELGCMSVGRLEFKAWSKNANCRKATSATMGGVGALKLLPFLGISHIICILGVSVLLEVSSAQQLQNNTVNDGWDTQNLYKLLWYSSSIPHV